MEHHAESPGRVPSLESRPQQTQYRSKAQELPSPTTASTSSLSPVPSFSAPRNAAGLSHNSLISCVSSGVGCDESTSKMDVDSAYDRGYRSTSVLSMDDIEAAQALEGLRSEYGQSPSSHASRSLRQQPPASTSAPVTESQQQEPLLSLLTATHPLISSAINGSMSAYTTSKSYSPRFKYGAEFIERNIGSPVASTVGTMSRKTGVEGGLRWALQRREPNDTNEDRSKRRKVEEESDSSRMDVEKGLGDSPPIPYRRSSSEMSFSESLPPYDDHGSPIYEEIDKGYSGVEKGDTAGQRSSPTWQSRLMISTSGLGVAMSEESLRSLTYCLKWLRWANGRLSNAIFALKSVLREWDSSRRQNGVDEHTTDREDTTPNRARLSHHIQVVKEDVLRTLKQVVDIVSKYAGGALPENARHLVRRHLTSLPQRFRIASSSSLLPDSPSPTSGEAASAHRILVLAQEGLDIMVQVSRVVDDTLVSAEMWCERLGRKRSDSKNGSEEQRLTQGLVDVKQPIVLETTQEDVQMTRGEGIA